jgi:ribosomal protein L11 methyltransferase
VQVVAERRESVIAVLLDLAPNGFEEVDRGATTEFRVYTDGAGRDRLVAVFPRAAVTAVDAGWEDRWRRFHRPVVAGGLWIGPPWLEPEPGLPAVVIDPGRAFGTGAHATTRLCIDLLADLAPASVLDVGCGSGVLAIAAVLLGHGPVAAVDNDPVAVEATRANAAANGVAVDTRVLDAIAEPLPPARVVVANVLLEPVEAILARSEARVAVTSGYMAGDVPAHPGWRRTETRTLDGWAADRFDREARGGARPLARDLPRPPNV